MKWSILILTMPERASLLERLMDVLRPQVQKFPDVEIFTLISTRSRTVGEQRQEMLNRARGEYVCFVDDDDLVSPDYVATIRPLLDGVDYIGFPVHTFRDGKFYGAAYHSLKFGKWDSSKTYAERDISHLNPIRRELALQAQMEGGFGEDGRWASRLRQLQIVKTEHVVPEVMYFYHIRTHKPEMEPVNSCA